MKRQHYTSVPLYTLKVLKERSVNYPVSSVPNSEMAAAAISAYLQEKDCEHLVVLMLDASQDFIGMALVTIGSISGMSASARDIFKHVLLHRANAFILGHNHPSGNTAPSPQDIAFTEKIKELASSLGCPLLDHIIVSSGPDARHFSFLDHGML